MEAIGRIAGRTSTSEFSFLVEEQSKVKKWQYIKIMHPEVGPILSQVTEISKRNHETNAECMIIGYRTERGFLKKPRTPLEPGSEVLEAEDPFVTFTLGLIKEGLYLGLLEGKESIKAFIDPRKMITKHLAILAKSGAGKSYAVGVILEELASFGAPVIIIDPHGEYNSIREPNEDSEDSKYFSMYGVKPQSYSRIVREFALNTQLNIEAKQLKLPIPTSAFHLIDAMPFKLTSSQKGLLYSVMNELSEKKNSAEFQDIISELELNESNAKWALISGLQDLERTMMFSLSPTSMSDLIKSKQITILNLKGSPVELQQIAVQSVLTELFEHRKMDNIPPFFCIIEEAHNFCPERGFGEAKSSKILRTIASEGRKFGLGLAIVSQRPARVDKNVLSQCTSQLALQVTNPNDLKAISSSFEGVNAETEKEIRNLPIGKSLLIGTSDYPIFVDIRVRKSSHGGRAQTLSLTRSKNIEGKSSELVYLLTPRVSPKQIELTEQKKIKNIKLVLAPILSVRCQQQQKNFHLLFDMMKLGVYVLKDGLSRLELPSYIGSLSPAQRKVLTEAAKHKETNVSELFMHTGLSFNEVGSIVESLVSKGLVSITNRSISVNKDVNSALDVSSFDLPYKLEYAEITAERIESKVNPDDVINFLKSVGISIATKTAGYIPFYKIQFADNSEKVIDAISMNLRWNIKT